jgi:putative membrane protein
LGFFFVAISAVLPSNIVAGHPAMIARPFVALLSLIGVIAIVVWIVQWASDYRRSRTALDILNERLARGEIDHADYEAKRRLISDKTGAR